MRLLGKSLLEDFKRMHPISRRALDRWIIMIEGADFRQPQDIRDLFGRNVDFVGDQFVFDIAGNKVRVIAEIKLDSQVVSVTHVLTHSDYNRNKWRN